MRPQAGLQGLAHATLFWPLFFVLDWTGFEEFAWPDAEQAKMLTLGATLAALGYVGSCRLNVIAIWWGSLISTPFCAQRTTRVGGALYHSTAVAAIDNRASHSLPNHV